MSRAQIVRLSTTWRHPLRTPQRVSQLCSRLRLVRSSAVQPHVSEANEMLVDVLLEGHAGGWEPFFWEKEHSIYGFNLRADFYADLRRAGKTHLYYGELQRSDLSVEHWMRKLAPYVRLYESHGHLFQVLIRTAGAYNAQRALLAMNEVLAERPKLRLFLISHEGKWLNRWGQRQGLIE
ncbi:MAG: hypothetical protein AB7O68_16750 [Pirellulales bacterium]